MKFNFRIDYVVTGHLRYGHRDVCIEADTEEEAREIIDQLDEGDLVFDYGASELHIDDYAIDDYDRMTINRSDNNDRQK